MQAIREMVPPLLRRLVMQVYFRLATGAEAEDLTELSFLPMSTREYIKNIYDYVTTGEPPRVCEPWRIAAANSSVMDMLV